MNPTRARQAIRKLAGQDRFRVTVYSAHRMLTRGVAKREVRAVLLYSEECRAQESGRWLLRDEGLTVIAEIRTDVIVVTVYRGDEDDDE